YRTIAAEGKYYTDPAVRELARRNSLAELDARLLEEFLISGCAIQRIVHERRFDGTGVWIDNVDPDLFFVNRYRDPRGSDISLIGQLHDLDPAQAINRFAGGDPGRAAALSRYFAPGAACGAGMAASTPLGEACRAVDFACAPRDGLCRFAEVWTLDSRPSAAGARMDVVWHCRWYGPDGLLVADYDSPFPHRSHPFAVKLYPLTDGEVHPFVEDVLDQQRTVNRMITLIDHMLCASAKGVLLYPMDQLPTGLTLSDISQQWAQPDGIIPVTGRGSHLPQQIVTNTANTGAYQLLQMQLRLFQDVSGVGDALLGRSEITARGAEMFDAQIRNSTIALADIFDTFAAFTAARNSKARLSRR
ncbi:MAG: hypothetical protein K2F79_07100, partial [Muribaculaceae bacterium]|nr:hypothetical protein [Muribaculaceae bacterium]